MLDWIVVDEAYLDFLRNNYESRIPYMNYGPDHCKPFFGVLFYEGDYAYVTQVSHPQPRHYKMHGQIDFIKIFDGNRLLCVTNLNYMFPIHKSHIRSFAYKDIDSYRSFSTEKEKNDYIALLKLEIGIMQTMGIEAKARKVYDCCKKHTFPALESRCFDFAVLEKACNEYIMQLKMNEEGQVVNEESQEDS